MEANSGLWETMSKYVLEIFPSVYKDFIDIDLLPHLSRIAGAFMGCVINMGREGIPVVMKPHRDVKERRFGVMCLCPFGNYEDGGVILWELKVVVELGPGDLLFFPDSLIHHSNEPVKGERNSVVSSINDAVSQSLSLEPMTCRAIDREGFRVVDISELKSPLNTTRICQRS